jgi:hypothetical protein
MLSLIKKALHDVHVYCSFASLETRAMCQPYENIILRLSRLLGDISLSI